MMPWRTKVSRGRKYQKFRNQPLEEHGECGEEGDDVHSPEIEASRGRSV